jgi:hypothetical protein
LAPAGGRSDFFNLREGVLKPDIYDPTINPVYADMLRHYGVVAMPLLQRDRQSVTAALEELCRREVCLRHFPRTTVVT